MAVPFPLSVKVTPSGRSPVSDNAAAGKPDDVTVKLLDSPMAKVTVLVDVMAGAWSTVSVKLCEAFGLTPLLAVIVIG